MVGGFGAEGADGSKIVMNTPTVGRIANGATVEREVPTSFGLGDTITINLNKPDFTTAMRTAQAINDELGIEVAKAKDASSVTVSAPRDQNERVQFVATLENLEVDPADAKAKIVVNARTGTIIIGQNVKLRPAAVTHGGLTVTIREDPQVSQPAPLSNGSDPGRPGEGGQRHRACPGRPHQRAGGTAAGRGDRGRSADNVALQRGGIAMGSIQASGGNLELTKSVIDDTRSLDRLRRMGGSADSSSREAALRQAATQFETIFTREMFKEMRKAGEDINPDGIGTSHTDKLYQGMLDDQIIAQDAERRASSSDRNHSGRKLDSIGESAGNTSSVSDTKGAGNSPAAGSQGVSARHLSRFYMPNETRAFSLDGYMGAVTNGKKASAMSFIENASAQKSFAAARQRSSRS